MPWWAWALVAVIVFQIVFVALWAWALRDRRRQGGN